MVNKADIIKLKPVEMTIEIMTWLESHGLIMRLSPGHHALRTPSGKTESVCLYTSDKIYGAHKMIGITVNRRTLPNFGTHPDNEDFLFIGHPTAKPLYLVVAICGKHELESKIAMGTLSAEDFVTLAVKYNDPDVSFFTMLKNVPHGECVKDDAGEPATFYVAEPSEMGIERTAFGQYVLEISADGVEATGD